MSKFAVVNRKIFFCVRFFVVLFFATQAQAVQVPNSIKEGANFNFGLEGGHGWIRGDLSVDLSIRDSLPGSLLYIVGCNALNGVGYQGFAMAPIDGGGNYSIPMSMLLFQDFLSIKLYASPGSMIDLESIAVSGYFRDGSSFVAYGIPGIPEPSLNATLLMGLPLVLLVAQRGTKGQSSRVQRRNAKWLHAVWLAV